MKFFGNWNPDEVSDNGYSVITSPNNGIQSDGDSDYEGCTDPSRNMLQIKSD
jgi:hypothetical protein